jgi:PAS domain S-box-containing protein
MFYTREKMDKSKNGLNGESTEKLPNNELFLIVSIDKNEKIIQFNKECEMITGYTRYEALNKDFFDFLIPKRYINLWRRMLNLARQNQVINNLKLPLLTKQKNEIIVPWSNFPVEEAESEIGNICLVGKLIIPNINEKGSLLEHKKEGIEDKEAIIEFIKAGIENKTDVIDKSNIGGYNKDEKIFNL